MSNPELDRGYKWWQWILGVLTFWPAVAMLVATIWPGTRQALTPMRIWLGYGAFMLVGFALLVVMAALFPAEPVIDVSGEPRVAVAPVVELPTPIPAGLGISRGTIQNRFEGLKYNAFVIFDEGTQPNGTPYVISRSLEKDASLHLIGPVEDIAEIHFFFFPKGGINTVEHLVSMAFLVKHTFPGISNPLDFVETTVEDVFPDGERTIQRRGNTATLGASQSLGMVFLDIERNEP